MSGSASEASYSSGRSSGQNIQQNSFQEDEIFDTEHSLKTGIFGVLYTVSKEKKASGNLAVLRPLLEFIQIFFLLVNPRYGFSGGFISEDNTAWNIISVASIKTVISYRGYTFFVAMLYVMVTGLVLALALCVQVGHSFQNNRFDYVWPIVFLRWYAVIFFQVLQVAVFKLFLMALDCQYFPGGAQFYNVEFPDVYCWAMPHLIHAAIAGFSLAVFAVLALLFTMGDMELNPMSRQWLAMGHSKVEVYCIGIKFLMTAVSVFVTSMRWMSVAQSFLALCLLWLYQYWQPHIFKIPNMVRCASFSALFYTAGMLIFMAWLPGVDIDNPSQVLQVQEIVTFLMWAGILPSAAAGAFVSYIRLRFYTTTIPARFKAAKREVKTKYIFKFTDAREVEMAARCARKWIDEDTPDPAAIKLADIILRAGMQQLPNNPYMILLYSSFLIDVQGSFQSGYGQLQAAKKADPSFLENFAIFSREQEHTQKESGEKNSDGTSDLVSYVEFQKNYRLIMKVHREALLAMRSFWEYLLHPTVRFEILAKAIKRIDVAIKQADRTYRNVLLRHPNSVKLLRLYARFMLDIKNDPWAASKWLSESEKMEIQDEAQKENQVFGGMAKFVANGVNVMQAEEAEESGGQTMQLEDNRAVVIMNAHCIVQMANKSAYTMFGYTKVSDLIGKNVNVLIPSPFAEMHNSYIKNHLNTGKRRVLDRTTLFIGLHHQRYVFPIKLTVTHLSGAGEDSMFMGMIEQVSPEKGSASAWVLSTGLIASVDTAFTDWFGHKASDVMGTSVGAYVVDSKVLEEVLIEAKRLTASEQRRGSIDVDLGNRTATVDYRCFENDILIAGRYVRHKYSDPVKVELRIRSDAIGSYQFFELTFRKQEPDQMLVVTDRMGRVRHATVSLAKLLDTTVDRLQAGGAIQAIDSIIPEPFAQFHQPQLQVSMPHGPHQAIPPVSCFSGITVCLKTICDSSIKSPKQIPVKLIVQHKDLGPADIGFTIQVKSVPLEQALNERRLSLMLDSRGVVVSVGDSPPELFGFDPKLLLGLSVSSFADVFNINAGAGAKEHLINAMLVKLAEKSTFNPGSSWRVGVISPIPLQKGHISLGSITENLLKERTVAATMTLKLKMATQAELVDSMLKGKAVKPRSGKSPILMHRDSYSPVSGEAALGGSRSPLLGRGSTPPSRPGDRSEKRLTDSSAIMDNEGDRSLGMTLDAFASSLAEEEAARPAMLQPLRGKPPLPPLPALADPTGALGGNAPAAAAAVWKDASGDGLMFEVEMWRSDLLTSVLEMDKAGNLVGGGLANPLCPPCLVFGASKTVINSHISAVIPQMKGKSVEALFDLSSDFGLVTSSRPAEQKSSMKKQRRGFDLMPIALPGGPVTEIVVKHLGDEGELEISAQAFWKMGSTTQAYLLCHMASPRCGRPSFAQWLLPPPGPGKNPSLSPLPLIQTGAGRQPVSAMKKQTLDHTRPESPMLRGQGQVGAIPDLPPSLSGGNNNNKLPKMARSDEEESLSSSGIPRLTLNVDEGDNRRLPKAAPDAGPNEEEDPDWVLSDLETLQKELDARKLPHRERGDSPMDSAASEQKETSAKGKGHNMLTPRDIDLDMAFGGGTNDEDAPVTRKKKGRTAKWVMTADELSDHHSDVKEEADLEKYEELDKAGSFMRMQSMRPKARAFNPIDEDNEGAADISPKPFGNSPRLNGFGAQGDADGEDPDEQVDAEEDDDDGDDGNEYEASQRQVARSLSKARRGSMDETMDLRERLGKGTGRLSGGHHKGLLAGGAEGLGAEGDLRKNLQQRKPSKTNSKSSRRSGDGDDDDDIAKLGVRTVVVSEGNEEVDEDALNSNLSDYKRGKRLKKLVRLLGSAQALTIMRRFKWHTLGTIGALILAHVVIFVIMVLLIMGVQESITDLNSSALATRETFEVAIDIKTVDILLQQKYFPSLKGLQGPDDLGDVLDTLDRDLTKFKTFHRGVYSGFRAFKRLPMAYGIRNMWDIPSINVSFFYNAQPAMSSAQLTLNLWTLGNVYLDKARNIYQMAVASLNSSSTGSGTQGNSSFSFHETADFRIVLTNGPNVVHEAYFQTLNGLMQVTVTDSNTVNNVNMIVMAFEGFLFVGLAVWYVWSVTQKVTHQRYMMYGCFMQIPQATVRSLSLKPISLTEDDVEDDDAAELVQEIEAAEYDDNGNAGARSFGDTLGHGQTPRTKSSAASNGRWTSGYFNNSSQGDDSDEPQDIWSRFVGMFNRRGRNQIGQNGKRVLLSSNSSSLYLVWPFVAWGVLIVAMNAARFSMLSASASSIALLNIVNTVLIRHHHCFFFALDLVASNSNMTSFSYPPYESPAKRLSYELSMFRTEYKAMLYGGQVIGSSDPHFALSDTGIATTDNPGRGLLYPSGSCICPPGDFCNCVPTGVCMCEDPNDCQQPNSTYYITTRNGLDALIQQYIDHFQALLELPDGWANFTSVPYNFIWEIGQADIEGGIVMLNDVYLKGLESVFQNTITLQIIQLVLALVLALTFIIFMIMPFVADTWVETRRIAELLSQLPPEIDVEAMVVRSLAAALKPSATATGSPGPIDSRPSELV